ncbi:hypothetical protein DFH28DRAFT_966308 [Melampsora americana]|nr:hypothetical protein DFH28DRAFT_966308 [Melampsora americana]
MKLLLMKRSNMCIIFWLSTSKPFQKIQKRFESQAELQPHIQNYLNRADGDPYIKSLLLPFVGIHSVKLGYVKACLHSCNVQESALKGKQAELYGLDVSNGEKYYEDQDFFIEMMYKASTYIEGLEEYLHSQVEKDKKKGLYKFKSNLSLEEEDNDSEICPICIYGFLKGQRVVKLNCKTPHTFHEQCMHDLISSSKGGVIKCPTCRRTITVPLPYNEHTFWGQVKPCCNIS